MMEWAKIEKAYRHFKSQYPSAVLFFRLGDFYETFYGDAEVVAQVLGMRLTRRSVGPAAIPLAGIPYHSLDLYLNKMIKAGYKVAVCEQVAEPELLDNAVPKPEPKQQELFV